MDKLQANQLEQFEDLLAQSARGIHLMFDNITIADIFKKPLHEDSYFTNEKMTHAKALLTSFLERESFLRKQTFIDSLNSEDRELLVRTYFHLVESAVRQINQFKH